MKTIKELLALIQQKMNEQKGLLEKSEALSAEETKRLAELDTELDGLEADVKTAQAEEAKQAEIRKKAAERNEWLNGQSVNPLTPDPHHPADPARKAAVIPVVRGAGKAANFKSGFVSVLNREATAEEKAYRFGMFALGALLKNERALAYCKEHGIELKSHNEGSLTAGGYLVPDEFEATLIDLREQYGVFRQYAQVSPMSRDTKSVPRRTGGLTAYAVGEGDAITESEKTWDNVQLVAKKWGVLAKMSSEIDEDSVIDLGNDLASEISYAFANKEDECGFNGDGTSTYHGITGVREKILGLSATRANIAGLVVGSGNAYSELTLADFEAVVGRLPQYADTDNARWFVHRSFYWNVMIKLMLASGGVTEAEVSRQGRNVPFLGYPVAISQVMPKTEANDQVCALFGDMRKAVLFGDRRMTTIALSEHLNFAEDQIAIRGTERFDVNVHDVGNASGTAALRVPGPIVGLLTAAA